ncbi:major facilitator superfamily domain-containing protein [Lactarius akahatsu]|uniref:Major facilitator superfamily domain-containing protein n=1 Tax=Lactarius akahatsu TaxID=416441 RepID=A0AAD4LK90_9AGAM|nr:major facilitator superfamily domain-containing protein [Lactarius akahatsu]
MTIIHDDSEEHEPLLDTGISSQDPLPPPRIRPSFWKKALPIWIAPVIFVSSLCRGMTLAPRVEVYTQIACRTLHDSPSSPDIAPPSTLHPPHSLARAPEAVHVQFQDVPVKIYDECTGDPEVQARAARIQASVKTTESILSAMTTGWLSHLSDRYGRKGILALSMFGALFMDFVYILVSDPSTVFGRHGEAFIIVAPLVEGVLGAQSTYNGITHAYVTDCTPDGSRAKIFATMQGMLNIGMASGPWLNGLLLHSVTGTTTSSLFVTAILIAITNLSFVLFILPESLPPSRRLSRVPSSIDHDSQQRNRGVVYHIVKTIRDVALQFLRPATLFIPLKLEGRRGRDWNLTLTGLALFLYVLADQVYNLKYLYVKHVYDWSTEQLGYYMSFLWIIRAANLLIILPLILAYFASNRKTPTKNSSPAHLAAAIRFDQRIAAISLFTDASANALVAISPTSSQPLFVFLTSLGALTSGGHPALQSLGAVSLRAMGKGNEVGLVFGALGLVNAVSHIVAPGIYAAIYGKTVATFPKAMFVMSAVMLYIAVTLLARVRPFIHVPPAELEGGVTPRQSHDNTEVEEPGEEPDAQVRSRSQSSEPDYPPLRRQIAT